MITLSEILIAVAALANGAKGHETMSKNATKVQDNTVFFMQGDQLYLVSPIPPAISPGRERAFPFANKSPPLWAASIGK